MKLDISGLIDDWGVNTVILRKSTVQTSSGRFSGVYSAVLSGTLWVQPRTDGGMSVRITGGLLDETTHVAISRKTLSIQAADRLLPSGSAYVYDVLDTDEDPTHNTIQLRRVKRT